MRYIKRDGQPIQIRENEARTSAPAEVAEMPESGPRPLSAVLDSLAQRASTMEGPLEEVWDEIREDMVRGVEIASHAPNRRPHNH
jgi:hypothetical protein